MKLGKQVQKQIENRIEKYETDLKGNVECQETFTILQQWILALKWVLSLENKLICECGYEFTKKEIENKPAVSDVETWNGCPKCGRPI